MRLTEVTTAILNPMFKFLPVQMDTKPARVLMHAIGQQESRFEYRKQMGGGPAHGFWQFERGTRASRGGCWGIWLHEASRYWLADICKKRGVEFTPDAIHKAIVNDDILAAACARLLLFTDAKSLPAIGDVDAAWNCYAKRTWRPGKPHRATWDHFYANAVREVT